MRKLKIINKLSDSCSKGVVILICVLAIVLVFVLEGCMFWLATEQIKFFLTVENASWVEKLMRGIAGAICFGCMTGGIKFSSK